MDEKNIPKKPVFEFNCVDVAGNPSGCPVCPTCMEPHYDEDNCPFCGQALDHT